MQEIHLKYIARWSCGAQVGCYYSKEQFDCMLCRAEYNITDNSVGRGLMCHGGIMDEIEHIFPEEVPVAADSVPAENSIRQAHTTITEYCRSQHQTQERLQHKLAEVQKRLLLLDELHQYVHDKWFLHVVGWFSCNKAFVESIDYSTKSGLPGAMMRTLREATDGSDELKKRYPFWMDTIATKSKLKPDVTSRHPIYHFQNGFFTVTIREPSYTARIEDIAGVLVDRMPADPNAIIAYLNQERKRVFERPFDSVMFLRKLLKNYAMIIDKDPELKDGEPVPIRRITSRLRDNEKNFRIDEFLVDLTRLLDSHISEIDGRTLALEQTKEIEHGLYVFSKHEPGYVGFVRFKRRE